jgi:hypothetical protein
MYSNDPTSPAYGNGVLDLMLASEYRATLLVGNQMVPRGSSDLVRAETSRIQLNEAEVTVEFADGTTVNSFTIPGNGFVDPSTGTEPGWGTFRTVLIDSATANGLRGALGAGSGTRSTKIGRVVTVVKVFGKTLGGRNVETGEFRYPIEVCYGCSVSFPASRTLVDGVLPEPNCKGCAAATDIPELCAMGQDEPVDCCLCHQALGAENPLCEPQP